MAIDRRAFDGGGENVPDIRPGTNKWAVLELLVTNPDTAFTRSDILVQTEIDENSVGPVLARLRDAGMIEHKMGHWAASSDERIEAFHEAVISLRTAEERAEPEDFSGWKEHAVDR